MDNFEKEDWTKALTVAEKITYVSEEEIYAQYKHLLENLFDSIRKEDKIFLLPSKVQDITTGSGKSSQLMTYYIKKIIENLPDEQSNRIIFLSNSRNGQKFKNDLKKNAVLVIFDDYIGSGHQIYNFINKVIFKLHKQYYSELDSTYILSLYISENGESYLNLKLPNWNIISQPRKRAFSRRGSVFGYEKKMKVIREFCHKYGEQFFIWDINKDGVKKKVSLSLGYKNSQELISFCYRTPNNTLPIIWSSANNWHPLFPRFANDIISEAKDYRKESAFLLHKAKLVFKNNYALITGIIKEDDGKLNSYITQNDVLLLCVMRLKKNGANLASICQKLDIRLFDYDELIKDGYNRGLFTIDGNFTDIGTIEYNHINSLKNKYDYDLYWKHNFENPNNVFYIPKKFNGRT
ncbi:hypothetical protein GCM10023314_00380 [Algibacter agarivorans]|uniref:Uncharacterized protein n=1 Tax=Algibacter agarivorans TaxID=1109741 RepID=A0ABP9G8P5_9FLAO